MDAWSKESLQQEVGLELDMPEFYMSKGSIVLLVKQGRVVRGIELGIYLPPGAYSRDVRVERDPASRTLRLRE